MRIGIAVMAHESRLAAAIELATRLDAQLVVDDGRGENATGDRAWLAAWAQYEDTDWCIVLQDDAIVRDDFLEQAQLALATAGDGVVSFYVGTGRPVQRQVEYSIALADHVGAAWLSSTDLHWGVGVALPAHLVVDMLEKVAGSTMLYDSRLGFWAAKWKHPIRYTWPSLVDHADGERIVKGQVGEVVPPRHAHRVGSRSVWPAYPIVGIAGPHARPESAPLSE